MDEEKSDPICVAYSIRPYNAYNLKRPCKSVLLINVQLSPVLHRFICLLHKKALLKISKSR